MGEIHHFADARASKVQPAAGVSGNSFSGSSGSGSGSPPPSWGDQAVSIGKLEHSVDWLWKAVAATFSLGLVGMISLYLLLASRIDDRYEKTGDKLDKVSEQISDLRVNIASMGSSNDNTQSGEKSRKTK
ncbi:MAG: hypothetical protein ACKO1N_03685 [Erythrobacter sp.]